MKSISILSAAAAGILSAACLLSCDPDNPLARNTSNPVEVSLLSADFSVTLLDHEQGYEPDSLYTFEGVWKQDAFYFGTWKLDPMVPNILPDGRNQLAFRIDSESAAFEGVNAASSSRCINIVQDGTDHTRYHLEWVAEGESTITFWNGEGASRREISFQATSKRHIPIETIKFRIDGELHQMTHTACGQKEEFHLLKPFPAGASWEDLPTFELVPVPLNATLQDGEIVYTLLTAALFRTDENGNGLPLTNEDGLVDNAKPWFLSYTYQDLADLWPGFRWLSTHTLPSATFHDDDPIEVNLNDLRERRTKVYTTRMKNDFQSGYCGQIYFEWLIHNHQTGQMSRDRDHIVITR